MKLIATAITDDGVHTETYEVSERSVEFARGFVCGYLNAKGVPPSQVQFELEQNCE